MDEFRFILYRWLDGYRCTMFQKGKLWTKNEDKVPQHSLVKPYVYTQGIQRPWSFTVGTV